MPELFRKLGIKPFGFQSLRRKSPAIVFGMQGLQEAQRLLGRCRAATAGHCARSAGLYAEQDGMLEALEKSGAGRYVGTFVPKMKPVAQKKTKKTSRAAARKALHAARSMQPACYIFLNVVQPIEFFGVPRRI